MNEQEQQVMQQLDDSDRRHIERLSEETDTPIEEVEAVYVIERARLQRVAKLKTFIPVIVSANVRKQFKSLV